ncbi:MAG: FAD-dependent oxidoreductase [Deltaproteobacteria bacterium]|nr:FAD-dependent oxidoreductase [Deltaproteobacteria bacterium]
MSRTTKQMILVGGGHAHMTVMLRLDEYLSRGHQVTLINRSPFHYYSGMGPGMFSGIYRPEEIRFHVRKMVEDRGGEFIEGEVVRVHPQANKLILASGDEVGYDVASFNTGSYVPLTSLEGVTEEILTVKPILNLLRAKQRVLNQLSQGIPRLVVVGGGAAGLEITGNLERLVRKQNGTAQITLLAGRRFLPAFPEKVRRLALSSFVKRKISVMEGARVRTFEKGEAVLEDERRFPFDLAILALGVRPSPLFADSGLAVGPDGGLLVNNFLQSTDYPELFGGGDCISLAGHPLDKVGVFAVRQNPVLHHNLMAALEGGEMQPFVPQKNYLLIFNLGDGRGIFYKGRRIFAGRTAFFLKDWIDRKFVKSFQVSGEQNRSLQRDL